jgi:uncharacterized protein
MSDGLPRRDFLKAAPAAAFVLSRAVSGAPADGNRGAVAPKAVSRLRPFDYQGVKLRPSRWAAQVSSARDVYFNVPDDDILHGFRVAAGHAHAPGKPLGGWCARDSGTVFGQWLSGMSRLSRATGDDALLAKAVRLAEEFAKTVGAGGDCRMRHYPFEKLIGGLLDLHITSGRTDILDLMERTTAWAGRTFDRERTPASPQPWELHSGRPLEWYTLPENFYRAYLATGDAKYRDFAEIWLYEPYWNKFAETSDPPDAYGVHAYSHVNSFSSAAMAHAVTGDERYLRVIRNAYDFLQTTQCYATGGFGPAERIMPTNGNLGKSLEGRMDSFESPCSSWAGFKLGRYLLEFTGEARYGDWIERLFYNGVGAALPIAPGGKGFYYADFRMAGIKYYHRSSYHCCTGTYFQNMAEYVNLVYFREGAGLCVNLFLPSEVAWPGPSGEIKLAQETGYPQDETSTLTLTMGAPAKFALKLRIPGWSSGVSVKVNGAAENVACTPGTWAVLDRTWRSGDIVEIRIPLRFRTQAIDRWHPTRVAVVRGPVVFVQEGNSHEPVFALPDGDDELDRRLVAMETPGVYKYEPANGANVQGRFMPYYAIGQDHIYRMYVDRRDLPFVLW